MTTVFAFGFGFLPCRASPFGHYFVSLDPAENVRGTRGHASLHLLYSSSSQAYYGGSESLDLR